MPRYLIALCLIFGVALPVAAVPPAAPLVVGPGQVVDGDTLRIGAVTLRLHGVDAPERDQSCALARGGQWPCGQAATARLTALVAARVLECQATDRDRYQRTVAVCRANGQDLGAVLVAEGLAWAFHRYSRDYAQAETAAQARRIGIWQARTPPAWEHRRDSWRRAAMVAPLPECPIKGNISAKGDQIYHPPWSASYARTRIDESKGERWFCDEAEAIAAGWRAARFR